MNSKKKYIITIDIGGTKTNIGYFLDKKLVKTINKRIHSDGFRSEGIPWNAKDDYGDKIARGVYVYTLKVSSENGEMAEKTEKLVILN